MRKMKDSGIEWLNSIPNNWEIKRLKNVLKERKENNNPVKTENILSLTNDKGVIPYSEKGNQGNKAKDDITGYKLAYENDIIMNSMNVIIGSVGLSKYYGCVSPVYYMLYTNKYNIKYYNYIFQSKVFQNELRGLGNGILEIRMRIPMEKMNNVMMPIPPVEEQNKIVCFLDKKISEIDNVIEKTKETIEDYKKYKNAIISESVTSGKEHENLILSNIAYLPYINKNFKLIKLKHIIKSIQSGVSVNAADKMIDNENEYGVLKTSSVSKNYFDIKEHKQVNFNEYDRVSCPVEKNTIIVSRMNTPELVGACGYVNEDVNNIFLPDRLWKVKFKNNQNVKFVWYYLISQYSRNYISSLSSGTSSSMQNISQGQFESIYIVLPSLEEQNRIVTLLDEKCNEINNLIINKEKIIEELEQYKKSLIYEYVTGKKEVI